MRYALVSALILCALVAQAIPQKTAKRKIPCKMPENAASCYWTRGRLGVYNGNPSFRIWKIGTRRILAVFSGPSTFPPLGAASLDGEHPEFPASISKLTAGMVDGHRVFADFEVCPLEPERQGEMQAVCIESARRIVVEK